MSSTLRIIIAGDARGAQKSVKDISTDLRQFARDALAVGGLDFLKGATESASSLIESQNKVNQVFGESSAAVREFGRTAADELGQSEQAANQATGTYGNLLQAFGIGRDQAAEMSVTLVRLASDLAAFNDVPVEEVITSLRASISGEIEPARRLGINLLDTRLKAEAMAMGLYDGVGALDASAKAQAAYVAILEDTTIAQGQFERESEGLLAQQMKARAEWENAKASLGAEFIPAFTMGTKAVSAMSRAFATLPGPLQVALVGATGLAVVWPRLVTGAAAATDAVLNFRLGLMGVREPGAGAANALGSLVGRAASSPAIMAGAAVGVAGLTIALIEMSTASKEAKRNADDLVTTAEATGDSLTSVFDEKLANTIAGISGGFDIGDAPKIFEDGVKKIGLSADELSAALQGTDEEYSAFRKRAIKDLAASDFPLFAEFGTQLDRLRDSGERAVDQQNTLDAAQGQLGISTDEVTAGIEENSAATDRNSGRVRHQVSLIEALNAAMERRLDRLDSIRSAEEAATSAAESAWAAAVELADAEKAAAGDSEERRDALAAETAAARGLADAKEAVADAQKGLGDAESEVLERRQELNEAYAEARERVDDLARAARQASLDERQAVLAVREAQEELNRVLRDASSSDLDKEKARLEVEQAQAGAADAAAKASDAAREAERGRNVENDEGVIRAKEALESAYEGVEAAAERVTDAQDGVRDAERRVAEAAAHTADVAEAAAERYEKAKVASREAAFKLAEAQADVTTAVDGTEAGVRALQTALREMALDYAPGSEYRKYLEDLIRDLGAVADGGYMPGRSEVDGEWADPPRAGIPQDETRDPVRPRARSLTVNVYGSDVQTKREAARMLEDHDDKQARGVTGG